MDQDLLDKTDIDILKLQPRGAHLIKIEIDYKLIKSIKQLQENGSVTPVIARPDQKKIKGNFPIIKQ
jgi:hypothetical protein